MVPRALRMNLFVRLIMPCRLPAWALMTFPGLSEKDTAGFEQRRLAVINSMPLEARAELRDQDETKSPAALQLEEHLRQIDNEEKETALRKSIAGRLGTSMESFSKIAGFDWRTNIALIGGFAAKEVIVSTLGTAYSMGEVDTGDADSLGKRLKRDANWNRVVAVAALIFIMFYAPCFVTVVCIARESSWKWGAFSIVFNTALAFCLAVAVYQAGTLLGY